ncbi:MAG: hypothetical protein D6718_13740 [Acidobacteria bacterium]|nr:MAG: hypothetical protein D6718_13740 [Acidobacteriota bacterium]
MVSFRSRLFSRVFRSVLILSATAPAFGFKAPEVPFPRDVDVRLAEGSLDSAHLERARQEVAGRFRAVFGERALALHWGDLSDRPQLALRRDGSALAALPEGGGDLVDDVRRFLLGASAAFGFSAAEVAALAPVRRYRTAGLGMTHLVLQQRVDGLDVFEGQVRVHVNERREVTVVAGEYFPGLAPPGPPTIGPEQALAAASRAIGLSGTVPPVRSGPAGRERRTVFEPGTEYLEPPTARLVLLPAGPGEALLAWDVRLWEAVTGWDNQYLVLISADDGRLLVRRLLTLYAADPSQATGLVFEEDPEDGPQVSRPFACVAPDCDPAIDPDQWIDAGQTLSRGNAVFARADWGGNNNDAINPSADGGPDLTFDFPFTDKYAKTGRIGDRDAAISNAFWVGNTYHDVFYAYGFDEAAGNFQDRNFGRGGLEGDHVNVDVQDSYSLSWVRNNANWNPTPDGTHPRTNYYLWTNPNRDGAFDAKVIWHEFSHGLSTRLVGGPDTICLSGPQPGGMGEGWGDFLGASHFSSAADDPDGPATVGEYVTGNHQRGVRRYPYHWDFSVNPLTYEDLCDNGSCEVHDEGEIWANVLWGARREMILQHGFDEGRRRIEQIVVDAMKLSPCNPNMVEMKDLILQANIDRYGPADDCLLRRAFARRGLGLSSRSNGTGPDATAAFDVIPPISDDSVRMAADKQTLRWSPQAGAIGYPIARGTFQQQPGNLFDNASCVGEAAGESWVDPEIPAPGSGFYYLVAKRDDCGRSGFGDTSSGEPRKASGCPQ